MKKKDLKRMIISNFINHISNINIKGRDLIGILDTYMNEDHVDELESLVFKNEGSITYSEFGFLNMLSFFGIKWTENLDLDELFNYAKYYKVFKDQDEANDISEHEAIQCWLESKVRIKMEDIIKAIPDHREIHSLLKWETPKFLSDYTSQTFEIPMIDAIRYHLISHI